MRKSRGIKGTLLYLFMMGAILFTFVLFLDDIYVLVNGSPTGNLTDKTEEDEEEVEEEVVWSGIYKSDNNDEIRIYKANSTDLIVIVKSGSSTGKMIFKISNSDPKQSATTLLTITQKMNYDNNAINVLDNNGNNLIYPGKYTKQQEYTMINYFNDFYGDDKVVLFSKWNGIYGNDTYTFKMYQNEDSLELRIKSANATSELTCEIENEKVICDTDLSDFELTLNEDSISINGKLNDKTITGSYNKKSSYTMEEIILDDM